MCHAEQNIQQALDHDESLTAPVVKHGEKLILYYTLYCKLSLTQTKPSKPTALSSLVAPANSTLKKSSTTVTIKR